MSKLLSQKKCDICQVTPTVIYDAPTTSGQWAWLCPSCWYKHRKTAKLGTGFGQKWMNEEFGDKLDG